MRFVSPKTFKRNLRINKEGLLLPILICSPLTELLGSSRGNHGGFATEKLLGSKSDNVELVETAESFDFVNDCHAISSDFMPVLPKALGFQLLLKLLYSIRRILPDPGEDDFSLRQTIIVAFNEGMEEVAKALWARMPNRNSKVLEPMQQSIPEINKYLKLLPPISTCQHMIRDMQKEITIDRSYHQPWHRRNRMSSFLEDAYPTHQKSSYSSRYRNMLTNEQADTIPYAEKERLSMIVDLYESIHSTRERISSYRKQINAWSDALITTLRNPRCRALRDLLNTCVKKTFEAMGENPSVLPLTRDI